jgi:PadR family transcriptional regulator, regulatory protein PadR
MTPTKADLLQGTLDMLVLRAVADESLHGYGLAQRLRLTSGGRILVPQGSLYPALHRLEQQGLIRAEWRKNETGRDAKFYSLTRAGRAQLEQELSQWERLSAAIQLALRNA